MVCASDFDSPNQPEAKETQLPSRLFQKRHAKYLPESGFETATSMLIAYTMRKTSTHLVLIFGMTTGVSAYQHQSHFMGL